MTTWWLIVVLFGGTDIPCTQENPKVGIWRRKDLTSLPRAPMICWQLQVSRVGMLFCLAFCNFTCFLLLLVPSRPPRSVAKKLQTFYMEDSSVAFTVYFANLEYLAVDKTKRLKRVSSCGRAPEHCNREKSKSFVPEPSLLEDFWHASYHFRGSTRVWMNTHITSFRHLFV